MPAQPAYDRLLRAALSHAVDHVRNEADADPTLAEAAVRAESVLTALARPPREPSAGTTVRDDLLTILTSAGHALAAAAEQPVTVDTPLTTALVARIRASALRAAADRYDQLTEGEWLHHATQRYSAGHDVPAQWLRDLADQELTEVADIALNASVLAVLEECFPDTVLTITGMEDRTPAEEAYYRDGGWSSFRERTNRIVAMRRAAAAERIIALIEGDTP